MEMIRVCDDLGDVVQVCPAVKRLTGHGAEFVDGRSEDFDAIILATGYKSNVASWLKVCTTIPSGNSMTFVDDESIGSVLAGEGVLLG